MRIGNKIITVFELFIRNENMKQKSLSWKLKCTHLEILISHFHMTLRFNSIRIPTPIPIPAYQMHPKCLSIRATDLP